MAPWGMRYAVLLALLAIMATPTWAVYSEAEITSVQEMEMGAEHTHQCFVYIGRDGRVVKDAKLVFEAQKYLNTVSRSTLARLGRGSRKQLRICDVLCCGKGQGHAGPHGSFLSGSSAMTINLTSSTTFSSSSEVVSTSSTSTSTQSGVVCNVFTAPDGSVIADRQQISEAQQHLRTIGDSRILCAAPGPADTNELFTAPGNAGQYVTFGTPISSVGFTMTFSVQAANDVHLAFMATAASRSLNAYEIVIGGCGNGCSLIRKGTQGKPVVGDRTAKRVSASEFRDFWLRWSNGRMTVGAGHALDQQTFLSAELTPLSFPREQGLNTSFIPAFGGWNTPVQFKGVKYMPDTKVCAYKGSHPLLKASLEQAVSVVAAAAKSQSSAAPVTKVVGLFDLVLRRLRLDAQLAASTSMNRDRAFVATMAALNASMAEAQSALLQKQVDLDGQSQRTTAANTRLKLLASDRARMSAALSRAKSEFQGKQLGHQTRLNELQLTLDEAHLLLNMLQQLSQTLTSGSAGGLSQLTSALTKQAKQLKTASLQSLVETATTMAAMSTMLTESGERRDETVSMRDLIGQLSSSLENQVTIVKGEVSHENTLWQAQSKASTEVKNGLQHDLSENMRRQAEQMDESKSAAALQSGLLSDLNSLHKSLEAQSMEWQASDVARQQTRRDNKLQQGNWRRQIQLLVSLKGLLQQGSSDTVTKMTDAIQEINDVGCVSIGSSAPFSGKPDSHTSIAATLVHKSGHVAMSGQSSDHVASSGASSEAAQPKRGHEAGTSVKVEVAIVAVDRAKTTLQAAESALALSDAEVTSAKETLSSAKVAWKNAESDDALSASVKSTLKAAWISAQTTYVKVKKAWKKSHEAATLARDRLRRVTASLIKLSATSQSSVVIKAVAAIQELSDAIKVATLASRQATERAKWARQQLKVAKEALALASEPQSSKDAIAALALAESALKEANLAMRKAQSTVATLSAKMMRATSNLQVAISTASVAPAALIVPSALADASTFSSPALRGPIPGVLAGYVTYQGQQPARFASLQLALRACASLGDELGTCPTSGVRTGCGGITYEPQVVGAPFSLRVATSVSPASNGEVSWRFVSATMDSVLEVGKPAKGFFYSGRLLNGAKVGLTTKDLGNGNFAAVPEGPAVSGAIVDSGTTFVIYNSAGDYYCTMDGQSWVPCPEKQGKYDSLFFRTPVFPCGVDLAAIPVKKSQPAQTLVQPADKAPVALCDAAHTLTRVSGDDLALWATHFLSGSNLQLLVDRCQVGAGSDCATNPALAVVPNDGSLNGVFISGQGVARGTTVTSYAYAVSPSGLPVLKINLSQKLVGPGHGTWCWSTTRPRYDRGVKTVAEATTSSATQAAARALQQAATTVAELTVKLQQARATASARRIATLEIELRTATMALQMLPLASSNRGKKGHSVKDAKHTGSKAVVVAMEQAAVEIARLTQQVQAARATASDSDVTALRAELKRAQLIFQTLETASSTEESSTTQSFDDRCAALSVEFQSAVTTFRSLAKAAHKTAAVARASVRRAGHKAGHKASRKFGKKSMVEISSTQSKVSDKAGVVSSSKGKTVGGATAKAAIKAQVKAAKLALAKAVLAKNEAHSFVPGAVTTVQAVRQRRILGQACGLTFVVPNLLAGLKLPPAPAAPQTAASSQESAAELYIPVPVGREYCLRLCPDEDDACFDKCVDGPMNATAYAAWNAETHDAYDRADQITWHEWNQSGSDDEGDDDDDHVAKVGQPAAKAPHTPAEPAPLTAKAPHPPAGGGASEAQCLKSCADDDDECFERCAQQLKAGT